MLTATTETAIKALVFLCQRDQELPASPREIVDAIGGSPTYMAKVAGTLTRAGIVKSRNGKAGGIQLAREPSGITLFDIVQACQGLVIADYCEALGPATSPEVCAFHQAMFELHQATVKSLSKWTLKMLAAKPLPSGKLAGTQICRMAGLAASCSNCSSESKSNARRVRQI